jgi:hypothetical protein
MPGPAPGGVGAWPRRKASLRRRPSSSHRARYRADCSGQQAAQKRCSSVTAPLPSRATHRDILALRAEHRRLIAGADAASDRTLRTVTRLLALRGIGEVGASLYTTELFAWRQFRRQQHAGACVTRSSRLRARVAEMP